MILSYQTRKFLSFFYQSLRRGINLLAITATVCSDEIVTLERKIWPDLGSDHLPLLLKVSLASE